MSRPVPVQVRLEVALDFQAPRVRLAVRSLEVETTIQQDLLALILPPGMRRDIRASSSNFNLRASSFPPGKLLKHKNRDGQVHDRLKEGFATKAQTLEELQMSTIYNDHSLSLAKEFRCKNGQNIGNHLNVVLLSVPVTINFFELFACWLLLQNRRMKWKKENKTKLDGPDMDESPESN